MFFLPTSRRTPAVSPHPMPVYPAPPRPSQGLKAGTLWMDSSPIVSSFRTLEFSPFSLGSVDLELSWQHFSNCVVLQEGLVNKIVEA